jgi:hypothetical protein
LRLQAEGLEERTVLSAFLALTGAQTLHAGTNVNATVPGTAHEIGLAINPVNPLQIAGFTNNGDEVSLRRSDDGGLTWDDAFTDINILDGLGQGNRVDPTLKFDADGHLFIAYGFDNGQATTLVTARSDDGGQTFFQFRYPHIAADHTTYGYPGLDKPTLTTGLDPTMGRQAVYIAYTWITNDLLWLDAEITVVGSNDGGFSYTSPRKIDDDDGSGFAEPAVGPNGELYVVWHDYENSQLKFDRDLDGLWGTSYNFGDDVVVRDLRENLDHKTTPAAPRRGFDNGPSIDVSRSWAFYGRLYVTFTDTFSGDDTDIYLVTSDDKGSTWHLDHSIFGAGNVEGSTGTDFMATVAVDQLTGSVNVGYYTTDGDQFTGNDDVNFRLASSVDGGDSWAWTNLSSAPSEASAMVDENEFGDYEGLAACDGTVHGMWTDNRMVGGSFSAEADAFTATASLKSATGGNTLLITGTSSADEIDVETDQHNPDFIVIGVNGQIQFAGLWATLDGIGVYAQGGDDLILINLAGADVPINVDGGDGNDTIIIIPPTVPGRSSGITVHGAAGADSVTLWNDVNPSGFDYTVTNSTVTMGGAPFGGLTYDTVESLTVRAGPGDDTFNINSTASSVPVTIDAGAGNDTVNVTPASGSLNDVQSNLTVNGDSGTDSLVLNDQQGPGNGWAYGIWDNQVRRDGLFGAISFAGVENQALNPSAGGSTIFVYSTPAGGRTTVNGGPGNDTFVVGFNGFVQSTLASIAGPLTINGQGGGDALLLNDSLNSAAATYTVTGTTVQGGGSALISYTRVTSLTLAGGSDGNLINVNSTAAGTDLTVNAGVGNDSITLGNGNLDPLRGAVTVNGQTGTDQVNLMDQGIALNDQYTVSSSTVSRRTAGGAATPFAGLTYGNVEGLTLNAATGNNVVTIASTASTTPVTVNGNGGIDTLVGPNLNNIWFITGSNQGTLGNVTFSSVENLTGGTASDVFAFYSAAGTLSGLVNGGGGSNSLDYSHHNSGVSVQLANSPAVGTATATGGVLNIQSLYGSRYGDTLIGNDQDNFFQTYGGRDVVRGNGGNDTIHLVGAQDPASIIDGGSGSNLLWPDNSGANTWTLTGAGAGSLSSSGFANGNALAFSNMQRLLGGRYADSFRVLPGASFSYLNGYAGTNWLDYSAYTSAVTVNLAAHTATGVVGANLSSIQNVIGSRTAANTLTGDGNALGNILVGGDGADTITAGTARSLLIGGRGADVLTGGKADDIVIGGFTDYDHNQVALAALLSEWLSPTDSYATRIAKLRAGMSVGASTYALVWGSGTGTTVHDDGSADTLRGDPSGSPTTGLDWFFANQGPGTPDTILDLQTGEKVANQP